MERLPKCYLLFHNISKPKNIGSLVRSACAFNVEKVFLISKDPEKKKDSKIMKAFGIRHGAQGTEDRIEYGFFFSVQEAKEYFLAHKIRVVGVEIGNGARSVNDKAAFDGDTVFILGNEGDGIHPPLKAICDHFVYIPQYTSKTASLNVASAGAIILHEFAKFAGYREQEVHGEKFRKPEQDELEREEKIRRQKELIGKRQPREGADGGASPSENSDSEGSQPQKATKE